MSQSNESKSEYQFSPQAWGMHTIDDDCTYNLLADPRRTGWLTDDRAVAVKANHLLEDFLNRRPSTPIRTYRSGTALTLDMIPVGSIVDILMEMYFMESNWHTVEQPRWGAVVKHKQYREGESVGIVSVPRSAVSSEGRWITIAPPMLQSVDGWRTPPGYLLHDLPLEVGAVKHERYHFPAGDKTSPDPNERLYAVLHPEDEDRNTLVRVIKVDLWHLGSVETQRQPFSLGNLASQPTS